MSVLLASSHATLDIVFTSMPCDTSRLPPLPLSLPLSFTAAGLVRALKHNIASFLPKYLRFSFSRLLSVLPAPSPTDQAFSTISPLQHFPPFLSVLNLRVPVRNSFGWFFLYPFFLHSLLPVPPPSLSQPFTRDSPGRLRTLARPCPSMSPSAYSPSIFPPPSRCVFGEGGFWGGFLELIVFFRLKSCMPCNHAFVLRRSPFLPFSP